MTPSRTVLVGLSCRETPGRGLEERFAGWVEELGYECQVTTESRQMLAWVRDRELAASLLDACLLADTGEEVWRRVRPILGRRLVLMAREPIGDIRYEALRAGVGALLPLPPEASSVRAAIRAATGTVPTTLTRSRPTNHQPAAEGKP